MAYPVDLELDAPVEVANWRPLVHWLLAVPHTAIAGALSSVGSILAVVSWVIILATGQLPEAIARFQCLVLRYEARAYAYVVWLHEPYPPFELDPVVDDPGTTPLRVDVRPQLDDRDRLRVGLRFIWAIPTVVFASLVVVVATVAVLAGFVAVLVTGRWPVGLRRFVVGTGRLLVRVNAYLFLLVDDYPPFALD